MAQSCTGQELPGYTLTDVPLVVNMDSIRMVPLNLTNVRYCPLETNRNCLIGHIDKALVRNNRIYVADFNKAIALFVFDMDGRFLFKIARMGKGPGEYLSFRDFDIHDNGEIYMFDHFGKKFLVFDQTGAYLRELVTDYFFSYFCLVKDKMYWSKLTDYGKKFADLAAYDMEENKTDFLLKDKKFLLGNHLFNYVSYRFYRSPPGITYYSPRFSEIVYAIDDKGMRPAIGIKNLRIPPEHIISEWESKDFGFAMDSDDVYFKENTHVYETGRYIVFICINKKMTSSLCLIYDKRAGAFSAVPIFLFGLFGVDGIKGSTGKDFFSIMSPHPDYKEHREILQSRKELSNWKEEDNPVIVFFDLDM
ncbi:MAG: 6-bladed beta-propeller [Bacteroidales bacterium]|nr:6-bladed beta-propeller [Bacteroidales bacterium]